MGIKNKFLQYADKKNRLIFFFTFLFFSFYYFVILYTKVATDIQAHIMVSYDFVNAKGPLTPNFLYFILVAILAGFSKYKFLYYVASILLLAFALAIKYLVNVFYIQQINIDNVLDKRKTPLLAIGLLFIFCLPGVDFFTDNVYYLGQSVPTVWHNSTVIFLMPFAIILFFKVYDLFENGITKKKWITAALLILLNALLKPSFLFTIIPAMALWAFFNGPKKFDKPKLAIYLLCTFGLTIILAEYVLIYMVNKTASGLPPAKNSGISIEPFGVWKFYSSSIPIAFVTSFLFPILFFILTKGSIIKDKLVKFTVINWVLGLVIFILLIEGGEGKYDCNFGWQMITANYLLFFVLSVKLLLLIAKKTISPAVAKVLFSTMLLHIIWGVVYFLKILIVKKYN